MNHINIIEAGCHEKKKMMKEWWTISTLLRQDVIKRRKRWKNDENIKIQYQLGFRFIKFKVYKSFYIIKTLQN